MGRVVPLTGSGSPESVEDGVEKGVIVAVGVAVGERVAEGVASPNTCVPLLRISNTFVSATVFPLLSTVVMVTLCLPGESVLVGV